MDLENGIFGRKALVPQARAARAATETHRRDPIVTLGGDCLIDLAPMAYLNTRLRETSACSGSMPMTDVLTPEDFAQGNAQVLGALLGRGDPELVGESMSP
jgi:arginase